MWQFTSRQEVKTLTISWLNWSNRPSVYTVVVSVTASVVDSADAVCPLPLPLFPPRLRVLPVLPLGLAVGPASHSLLVSQTFPLAGSEVTRSVNFLVISAGSVITSRADGFVKLPPGLYNHIIYLSYKR